MDDLELFTIPGSNACISVELLLAHAGVPWRERRLRPMLHVMALRARGFSRPTVPAARIDGVRVQGSRQIAHTVAERYPDLGLLPADPAARERVLAAEQGAERFQIAARRLVYVLAQDDPSVVRPLVDASFGGLPALARTGITRVLVAAASKGHRARRDRVGHELKKLAELLDEFDRLVGEGLLAGDVPNVADFQLAPNLALLAALPELAPVLHARPAWRVAERLMPRYPLEVDAHAPQAWADRLAPR